MIMNFDVFRSGVKHKIPSQLNTSKVVTVNRHLMNRAIKFMQKVGHKNRLPLANANP